MKSTIQPRSLLSRLHPAESLGLRLFLVFFIATMTIVLSLGYTSYSVAEQTIEDNALSSNQQTVIQTAEKLDVTMLRYEDNLGQIAYNKEIQHAMKEASQSASGLPVDVIATELSNWLSSAKSVQAVYLIPVKKSLPIVAAGAKDEPFMESARSASWFSQLSDKPEGLWLTKEMKGATAPEVFHYAKAIAGESQDSGYVAISDIKVSEVEKLLGEVNLGTGSYIQLLTEKDELIASSMQNETDTYLSLGGTLFTGLKQASSGALPTKNEEGKSILAVYGTMQSSGWKLLGVVPAENLTQDAVRILKTTYIAVGAAAVIAILIGLWMVRMVARPLTRLKDLMFQGAEGNLSVRTSFKSRDEIGQLSLSFNTMMERITELVDQTNETAQEVLEMSDVLSSASRKTASAAKDIAAAMEEVAGGAGSLALEADNGNALSGQISEQMNKVTAATHEMNGRAHSVGQFSTEGVAMLKELKSRTQITEERTRTLVNKVNNLQTTASSVIQVLDVMQRIVQQTNILSLNASIEAARAGDAGQGFMVVASEIRQLADQSRSSIAVVGEITDRIMLEMNETVTVLDEVAPLFGEQSASVQSTSDLFVSVQGQMNEFITFLDAVTGSIDGLGESQRVLSETMDSVSIIAEQSSAASQEVASLSGEQQSVSDHLVELSASLQKASAKLRASLARFRV
ncbi:methyl-accepting chemotaxis protein [Paenibacillus sp. NPDC057934]|uniref:methyl-accepting chemotaxis protein n=1 Tax=Paenibacillus sp. NPDC057934 TaxID=3346282 RepID=UPI0036D8F9CC